MNRFTPRFPCLCRRKYPPENAGKGISACIGFKIFCHSMPPDLPRGLCLDVYFSNTACYSKSYWKPCMPARPSIIAFPYKYQMNWKGFKNGPFVSSIPPWAIVALGLPLLGAWRKELTTCLFDKILQDPNHRLHHLPPPKNECQATLRNKRTFNSPSL